MYQLDEKLMSDARAIIALAQTKDRIEEDLKPGMVAYEFENREAYLVVGRNTHHRFIKENEDGRIHGQLVFKDPVEFKSGITIQGEITNVETVDLVVSDNIIEINKDETAPGISRISAGLKINRGLAPHYYTLFNERSDKIDLGVYTHVIGETVLSKLYSDGSFWLKDHANLHSLTVRNNAVLDADLLVKGNSKLNGTLTVDGQTTLNGRTSIESDLVVAGSTTLNDSVTMNNTLHTIGNVDFDGNLSVGGKTDITGDLNVIGHTTIAGDTSFRGDVTINALEVLTTSILNGSVTAKDNLTVQKLLSVLGDASFAANATVTGHTLLNTLQTNGAFVAASISTFNENVTMKKDLVVNNNVSIQNLLTVSKNATFNSDVTINKALNVLSGATTLKELIVNQSASIAGTLTVNTVNTVDLAASRDLTVGRDASINHDLTVSNRITCRESVVTKHLTVEETSNMIGRVTMDKGFTANANSEVAGSLTISQNAISSKSYVSDSINLNHDELGRIYRKPFIASKSLFGVENPSIAMDLANASDTFKYVIGGATIAELKNTEARFATPIKTKVGNQWANVLDSITGHKASHYTGGTDEIRPSDISAVKNAGGVHQTRIGNYASMGAPHASGEVFHCIDKRATYFSNNGSWIKGNLVSWGEVSDKPTTFTPPIATDTVLGGVKIGRNIQVASDGTISVPHAVIEYSVHRKEFIVEAVSASRFIVDVDFTPGYNLTSVYVFGRMLPPSAYREIDNRTIELVDPVEQGTHVEIVALVIPTGALFSFKREEYYATEGQTDFVLANGQYLVGEDKIKVYMFGALLPPSAYDEISIDRIQLKEPVAAGTHIMLEYLSDPELRAERMSKHTASPYLQASKLVSHPVFETNKPLQEWLIVHNQNRYMDVLPLSFEGIKLNPESIHYLNANMIRLTFTEPTVGRVMINQ